MKINTMHKYFEKGNPFDSSFTDNIIEEWNTHYGRVKKGNKYLTLVTGGWSENEEILAALEKNWVFWSTLDTYRAGGYYRFKLLRGK